MHKSGSLVWLASQTINLKPITKTRGRVPGVCARASVKTESTGDIIYLTENWFDKTSISNYLFEINIFKPSKFY